MPIEVRINGNVIPAGGAFPPAGVTVRGGEELRVECVITGPVAANGPWRYMWYLTETAETINEDSHEEVPDRHHAFRRSLLGGTYHLRVAVLSIANRRFEDTEIILNLPHPPAERLLVRITQPERNAFAPGGSYEASALIHDVTVHEHHEKISFACEVVGGRPPYTYTWVSRYPQVSAFFQPHFDHGADDWPADDNAVVLSFTRGSRSNRNSFDIGGESRPLRLVPFGAPPDECGHLPEPKCSLPDGTHQIVVKVKDSAGIEAETTKTIRIGQKETLEPTYFPPTGTPMTPGGAERFGANIPAGLARRLPSGEQKFRTFQWGSRGGGPRQEEPMVRGAINQAKRELHAMAERRALRVIDEDQRQLDEARANWQAARDAWRQALNAARNEARGTTKGKGASILSMLPFKGVEGATTVISDLLGGVAGARQPIAEQLKTNLDEAFANFSKTEDDMRVKLDRYGPGQLREQIEKAILGADETLISALVAKYYGKHRLRQLEADRGNAIRDQMKGELESEAQFLVDRWTETGRNQLGRTMTRINGLLRSVSWRMQTLGDVWYTLIHNLWELVTGPWVTGSIMLFLYWLLIGARIPQWQPLILWTAGITGALTWLLNIEEVKFPLDWLTHIFAGMLIGGGTAIFLIALMEPAYPQASFPSAPIFGLSATFIGGASVSFWILWGFVALFIGLFQFYQAGGYRVIFQISVIVLAFSWLALGPYSGQYKAVVEPVAQAVGIGFKAVSTAVTDVWLLGTNPTEFYARQQLRNVRPEKPVDYPKGVEIVALDISPPTVPASSYEADRKTKRPSYFFLTIGAENKAERRATNVKALVACDGIYCMHDEAEAEGKLGSSVTLLPLEPGAAARVQFRQLRAWYPPSDREAEFQQAKVTINISYNYSTSSALPVTVASRQEIERRQLAGENIFNSVPAVVPATTAQISMSVGPQPLESGTNRNGLLVGISNTRDDGIIDISDAELELALPNEIGSNLICGRTATNHGGICPLSRSSQAGKEVRSCIIPANTVIKDSSFSQIYALQCEFDAASGVERSKTGLVTAELKSYAFTVTQKKNVPISTPLGLLPLQTTPTTSPGPGPGPPGPVPPGPVTTLVPEPYYSLFSHAAAQENTPLELIAAVFKCGEHADNSCPTTRCVTDNPQHEFSLAWPNENGPWASSSAGAQGPFQFIPSTWAGYSRDCSGDGIGDVQNLNDAACGAAAYLKACETFSPPSAYSSQPLRWKQAYCYNRDADYATKVNNCYDYLRTPPSVPVPVSALVNPAPGASCAASDYSQARGPEGVCDGTYVAATSTCLGTWIHGSVDIVTPHGSDVRAAHAGIARETSTPAGGRSVTIEHADTSQSFDQYQRGWSSYYAHLDSIHSDISVAGASGKYVLQGEVIGTVGCTGCPLGTADHLHFSVYKDSAYRQGCKHADPCFACGCTNPVRIDATC